MAISKSVGQLTRISTASAARGRPGRSERICFRWTEEPEAGPETGSPARLLSPRRYSIAMVAMFAALVTVPSALTIWTEMALPVGAFCGI